MEWIKANEEKEFYFVPGKNFIPECPTSNYLFVVGEIVPVITGKLWTRPQFCFVFQEILFWLKQQGSDEIQNSTEPNKFSQIRDAMRSQEIEMQKYLLSE